MHLGFAVRPGWADAFAISKPAFAQLQAPFTFSTASLSGLICFIQSNFPGENALLVRRNWILRDANVNRLVVTVDERNIDEGIARYTLTACLLQDDLEEGGACVWVS